MNHGIMILGGYGAFGQRIAKLLADKGHDLYIVGRNKNKADALSQALQYPRPEISVKALCFDINKSLDEVLNKWKPAVVIHTCGPFQDQNFHVLKTCIKNKVHYIDLADGRDFVAGIRQLNDEAITAGITAITGASTVPALSSAVLKHFQKQGMLSFDEIKYGISPGQKTDRGLATAEAVLSYIGKPIKTTNGNNHGWQNIYLQKYPEIKNRLMGNCEVPDIDLLPEFFPIKKLRFSAGMESKLLHIGIWVCSWLVRLGLPLKLSNHAKFWMKLSRYFDILGSEDGGMHVLAKGKNCNGDCIKKQWFIVAKGGDGPYIPAIPAVILADKLARNNSFTQGVTPCVGLLELEEYLFELSPFQVTTH